MFGGVGHNTQFGGPLAGPGVGSFGNLNSLDEFEAFAKAVQTAGDPNVLDFKGNLTGVPAIRLEALDGVLRAVTEREETYTLWRRLTRKRTRSSVHEWSTKTSIGGDVGGTFHSEYASIRKARTEFKRDVLRIKYLMTSAEITVAAKLQQTIEDIKAEENESATNRLLRDVEWSLFAGDESVLPQQFDGIYTKLARDYPKHIIDLDGSSDTEEIYNAVYDAFARVRGPEGGYGKITDAYVTPSIQNDLDLYLHPQWRVRLDKNTDIEYGAPVLGINTSHGKVALNQSVWIEEGTYENITAPVVVRAKAPNDDAPAAPTLTASAQVGPDAESRFGADRAGTYWYAVAAISEKGEGPLSAIQAVTISADGFARLEIEPPASPTQSGFVIYRSMQDPAAAPEAADLRLVQRVPNPDPENPSTTLTYDDKNHHLPGASKIFLLELTERSIDWTQLLPLMQFPLYPTDKAAYPWAVLLFGALKLAIPQRHWVVTNVVPKNVKWKPHG